MNTNYYIENIFNLSNSNISEKIIQSDVVITKSGKVRCVLKHFGKEGFAGVKIICINGDDISEVESLFLDFSKDMNFNKDVCITVDISLINRKAIATLFSLIARLSKFKQCSVNIIYALAKYSPPSRLAITNNLVKPVSHFFSGWSTRPGLPVMSIVGLGYEKDKALGAIEYLESSQTWLYIPHSLEERYRDDVINENMNIMQFVDEDNKLDYKVENPTETIYSLDAILTANKRKYKVVLLPFGPKIFYAVSLVSAIPHPEASVWYVSGEDNDNDSSQDREIASVVGFHFEIKTDTK